mmetsp:Transcript_55879/g.130963  ORF Transcript_55879/g.130963 Transcript_55879/m.130963 type:complete len:239 (+) Transcript_55879:437-1153(+)
MIPIIFVFLVPLVGRARAPVDRGDQPREPQPQEHVHRVGSGHVPNSVVRGLVGPDGKDGGKGVGERGAESHDGEGCDRILEADKAAENGGEVANNGGHAADHHQGDTEARPTPGPVRGRDESGEELPADGEPVHDAVHDRGLRQGPARVHVHRLADLLAVGELLELAVEAEDRGAVVDPHVGGVRVFADQRRPVLADLRHVHVEARGPVVVVVGRGPLAPQEPHAHLLRHLVRLPLEH